jgi:nitrite reductase/ring-hydroxylating ferredoxin subunit
MKRVVCRSADVEEGQARGYVVGEGAGQIDLILARRDGVLLGYVNSCPHQGVPLETFPDKFLTADGSQFICSAHGARFRVEDGFCVSGPCEGKSLRTLAFSIVDGAVVIDC